jgi:MAF protein
MGTATDPFEVAGSPRLVLASSSPRRRELLHRAGLDFELVAATGATEIESDQLSAGELALLNALRKARAAAQRRGHRGGELVLGADTLVTLDGAIFGKPRDRSEAIAMLGRLQGRTHTVFTGVALVRGRACELFAVATQVTFKRMNRLAIEEYVELIDPLDKAGAYAAQEHGERIIAAVAGSWTNVMGLPMEAVMTALARHGISSDRRQNISSASPWESIVGYSRAVRVGRTVHVAGTTATGEDGEIVAPGDPAGQTRFVLEKIARALAQAGVSLRDVVRTRLFVTDITNWEAIGRIHGEFFAEIRPAATMVEVSRLITPGLLVEIEADAVLPDSVVSTSH